jgi:hypothetical protein
VFAVLTNAVLLATSRYFDSWASDTIPLPDAVEDINMLVALVATVILSPATIVLLFATCR